MIVSRQNAVTIFIPSLAFQLDYRTPNPEWRYDEANFKQTNITTGHSLRIFDPIRVQVGIVDVSTEYRRGNELLDIRIIKPAINEPLEGRIVKKKRTKK